MTNLPYLSVPKGTRFYIHRCYNPTKYYEIGMMKDGFLEGWGMIFDDLDGKRLYKRGTFHRGELHGIGATNQLIDGIQTPEVGFYLDGKYIPDKIAFGNMNDEVGEYVREADSLFPYKVYLTITKTKGKLGKIYSYENKAGFVIQLYEDNDLMYYHGLDGLSEEENNIQFICDEKRVQKTKYLFVPLEDIPDTESKFPFELQPKYNISLGKYVDQEGTIKFNYGYYKGEVDEDGLPHGYGRFEWGDDPKHYHNHEYTLYEGEWKHGKYDGYGILMELDKRSNLDSRSCYKGNFKDGEKHGKGLEYIRGLTRVNHNYDEEYILKRGNFVDGKLEGKGEVYSFTPQKGEEILFSDNFINGTARGIVTIFFKNGDMYHGEYNGYSLSGNGKYTMSSGISFEAKFASGAPQTETVKIINNPTDSHFIMITRHIFGWSTDNKFIALFPLKLGKTNISDMSIFSNDAGLSNFSFNVLNIDKDTITYTVDGFFSKDKKETVGTIKLGETNKHGYSEECSGTMYGDSFSYSEGHTLTVLYF